MATLNVLWFSLVYFGLVGGLPTPDPASHQFEKRFIDTLSPRYEHHNETIKLIGFKTVIIPMHARADFEESYNTYLPFETGYESTLYDATTGHLRLYFPVQSALLRHDSILLEANHLGEFALDELAGDYVVHGRKQTEQVHGVDGNIIKDGIIYLDPPAVPVSRHGKIFVYDFGWKDLSHDHDHSNDLKKRRVDDGSEAANGEKSGEQKNRGCVANHGGINCSKAYGINKGRCPMKDDTCMDYNGYAAQFKFMCKKSLKYVNFLGSDCFFSVAMGNCWNEVEAATRPENPDEGGD